MSRGKPFSGKQKKDQLKAKKERKRVESEIVELDSEISLHDKRQLARDIIKSSENDPRTKKTSVREKLTQSDNNNQDDQDLQEESLFFTDSDQGSSDEGSEDHEKDNADDINKVTVITFNNERINNPNKNHTTTTGTSNNNRLRDIEKQLKAIDNKKRNVNSGGGRGRNQLVTIFEQESKKEIQERKLQSTEPLDVKLRSEPWLINQNFDNGNFIDIPKRVNWNSNMSAAQLEEQERTMFIKWLENISERYDKSRLNYFEHNLEVWRQLWRVSERSDIILLITDARYPLFHFPPALYNYIINDLKKPMVLVLNKIDLVDKRIVNAWIDYFKSEYPHLSIISFSSFSAHRESDSTSTLDITKKRKLKKGFKKYESSKGKQTLIKEILSLNIPKANQIEIHNDISKFLETNNIQMELEEEEEEVSEEEEEESDDEQQHNNEEDEDESSKYKPDRPSDSMITIGMLGHPNVGKSSLINGIMGRKVVSTSRTPGHTKHFQTILLTRTIQLCDCPGLVFPALDRPKPLQILCGIFPIAQVREPYSAIRYLAERVPLEKVYALENPYPKEPWSPWSICEAFANKRGYIIANTGAEDTHRAGLEILKDCVDGNVVISWPPPSFNKEEYIKCGLTKLDISDNGDDQNNKSSENIKDLPQEQIENQNQSSSGGNRKKLKNKKKVINFGKPIDYDIYSISKENEKSESIGDEEMPLKVYKKKNHNRDNNNNNTGYVNIKHQHQLQHIQHTSTQNNTNTNNNNNTNIAASAGKSKKLSAKALDYQERLAEKQNKGGNKRQIFSL